MDSLNIVTSTGVQISGSVAEVIRVLKLAYGIEANEWLHYSETKNTWVAVQSMHTFHLRNAIAKRLRDLADAHKDDRDPQSLVRAYRELTTDVTFTSLLVEYAKREAE